MTNQAMQRELASVFPALHRAETA
ncbi:MAG: hypothetical protein JWO33_1471, partial [Caulobacteraceae bacterium]|nr:hypothetical protein [Caulobacteraceae bacterium]